MKYLLCSSEVEIPEDVVLKVKSRKVTVTGKFGVLTKSFKDTQVDMKLDPTKKKLLIEMWLVSQKNKGHVTRIASVIKNMINGVKRSYKFIMKAVYAHFPINVNILNNGKEIDLRNYLGERHRYHVKALEGVRIARSQERDKLEVTGIDLEKVSQTCAMIAQILSPMHRDKRKFLDGIYVCAKGYLDSEF